MKLDQISRLGHSCVRVEAEKLLFVDPFQIATPDLADIVLITHDHYDHCSPDDIRKVSGKATVVVAPACCKAKLQDARWVKVGDKLEVAGVDMEVVPAYNTSKPFHPKSAGHVGYVFTLGGTRIYHAGDTDCIPEMEAIRCDVALLPVSGTYVMDATEAATAAEILKPEVAVPIHYGAIVGTVQDARQFRTLYRGRSEIL